MQDLATLGLAVESGEVISARKFLEQLTAAAKKAEDAATGMGKRTEDAAKRAAAANDNLAKSGRQLNSVYDRLSGSAMRVVRSLTAMAAAALGVRATISTLTDFEHSMAQVAAISRATTSELAALRDMAKHLGGTTEYTTSQVADGLRFLSMAGFTAEQSLAAIPAVLDLATATFMDLSSAADITSNIMSAFGISATDAAHVADVLAAAAADANTDIFQMGDAMKYVGPVASALSISMNDAAAAIGTLSDAGIQGSMAGTSLRRILSSLSNPVGETAKVIRSLGLSLDELNPKTTSIVDIIDKLRKVGLQASEAFRIFGDRGAPAILALIENEPKLRSLTKTLEGVEGEASRMAKTMRDSLRGDFKNLSAAVESLDIALGEAGLTAALRAVLQAATAFVRVLADNANGLITVLASLAAAHIVRMVAALATMTAGMGVATAAARALKVALAALGGPLGIGVMITSLAASFLLLRDNVSEAERAARDAIAAFDQNKQALNDAESASRGYSKALRDQIAMQVEATRAAKITAEATWQSALRTRDSFRAMTGLKFAPLEYRADVAQHEADQLTWALAALEDQLERVDANLAKTTTTTDTTERALEGLDKAAAKAAKAYERIVAGAKEFIAAQELERQALSLTEQEANRLRYTQDLLNQAQRAGINLTAEQVKELEGLAAQMANAEAETNALQRAFDFAKDVTKGFFSDLRSGLENGEGFWRSFANAASRALDKIVDKIMDDLLDAIFQANSALGGLGGGGGFLGAIGKLLGFSRGGVFNNGHVTAFAAGGVVTGPTVFPMRSGVGLMGEAGPEAIMPLRRGRDGRLGVEVAGNKPAQAVSIDARTTIHAPNADREGLARLEAMIRKRDAEFPARVVDTIRKAQKRRSF